MFILTVITLKMLLKIIKQYMGKETLLATLNIKSQVVIEALLIWA